MKQFQRPAGAGSVAGDRGAPEEVRQAEAGRVRNRVEAHLRAGQPQKALDLLAAAGDNSAWAVNAAGVCLLRLGEADRAVQVFRSVVLGAGGVCVRRDVPTVFRTNFALALLATGNVSGGVRLLDEIRDEGSPPVRRTRDAVRRWRAGLSFWQRVRCVLGDFPAQPVVLEDPGDL